MKDRSFAFNYIIPILKYKPIEEKANGLEEGIERSRSRSRSIYHDREMDMDELKQMTSRRGSDDSIGNSSGSGSGYSSSSSTSSSEDNPSSKPKNPPESQQSREGVVSNGGRRERRRRSRSSSKWKAGVPSKNTLNIMHNIDPATAIGPGRGHVPSSKIRYGNGIGDDDDSEEERLAQQERQSRLRKDQEKPSAIYGAKDKDCEHLFKILLLGDSGVGKTSLIKRYAENEFAPHLLATAGVDFKVKIVTIAGKKIKIQLWDTAGQERFHHITRSYYRGAHGIALVYDITDSDTFKNVNYWMANIAQTGVDEKVSKIILGNKADMEDDRKITTESREVTSEEFGIPCMETSAKIGNGVEDAFTTLIKDILRKVDPEALPSSEIEVCKSKKDAQSTVGPPSRNLHRPSFMRGSNPKKPEKCCIS